MDFSVWKFIAEIIKEHLMLFPKDRRKYKLLFLICIYFIEKYFPANKNSNLLKAFKLYIFKIISGFLKEIS